MTDTVRGKRVVILNPRRLPVGNLMSQELVDYTLARQELEATFNNAMADYMFRRTDAEIMGEEFTEEFPQEMIELGKELWPIPEDDGYCSKCGQKLEGG